MKEKTDKKTVICELLKQCIDSFEFLNNDLKAVLENHIEDLYEEGNEKFYEMENVIHGNEEAYQNTYISFKRNLRINESAYILEIDNEKVILKEKYAREIIGRMSDIIEDVLPLGTVVRLKPEYIGEITGGEYVENADMIIVNRFSSYKDVKAYFHYEALPYPTGQAGMSDSAQKFVFTPNLIEEVIYKGYEDERETAFIYAAKQSIIIKNKMISIQFADSVERKKYQERSERIHGRKR